jgi:D-serine deaminase-like pyridoxal phosphate-dependent protein
MAQRPPARPGDPVERIDTPALCVELDAFERNLDRMAAGAAGLRLRPHAKSHKCPEVAHAQLARGAVGICCQKTDEALAFVAAGVRDVLVTNEVVAPAKMKRLCELAREATIGVLFDAAGPVAAMGEAADAAGVVLDAYVEVDVGAHRCGVAPGAATVALARAIAGTRGLRLRGLQCYQGAAQHLRTPAERRDAIAAAAGHARSTRALLVEEGIGCERVTGAGTGTWPLERDSGAYDELQPGSYVFMDADYSRNTSGPEDLRFEQSLFVHAAVMSLPAPGRAIVDAGLKAFSFDSGLPQVDGVEGLVYRKASDEHGVLEVEPGCVAPALGQHVRLVPGHCDPTVNLYDWLVACRGTHVEAVWAITARGALG